MMPLGVGIVAAHRVWPERARAMGDGASEPAFGEPLQPGAHGGEGDASDAREFPRGGQRRRCEEQERVLESLGQRAAGVATPQILGVAIQFVSGRIQRIEVAAEGVADGPGE